MTPASAASTSLDSARIPLSSLGVNVLPTDGDACGVRRQLTNLLDAYSAASTTPASQFCPAHTLVGRTAVDRLRLRVSIKPRMAAFGRPLVERHLTAVAFRGNTALINHEVSSCSRHPFRRPQQP